MNAKDNKTTNKTQAFINAHKHSTKSEEAKKQRKQHQQHTSKTKLQKIQTHKTKAFLNAPTQKHKHQSKHQQNTSTQPKLKNKQIQTTTQKIHPKTNKTKTIYNHHIFKPTLHKKRYKIFTKNPIILQRKEITNLYKTKLARPNGLALEQNTHKHNPQKNPKQQNTNLYKKTPKQKIIYNKTLLKTHTTHPLKTYYTNTPNETKLMDNHKNTNTTSPHNNQQLKRHKKK